MTKCVTILFFKLKFYSSIMAYELSLLLWSHFRILVGFIMFNYILMNLKYFEHISLPMT